MALLGIDPKLLLVADEAERSSYFEQYTRYMPDAPHASLYRYVIRIGSHTLHSDDTHDLRMKFNKFIGYLKQKQTKRVKREMRKKQT